MQLQSEKTNGLLLKLFNDINDVAIGKILSPHGVGGVVKAYPYSDYPERISKLRQVDLIAGTERRSMIVEKATVYGRLWMIKFKGIDTRDDGRLIGGSLMVIPRHERMPLPNNHFYHDQLVGLKVYDSGGELLGLIIDIISTGGHDLLLFEKDGQDNRNAMIPFVREFIKQVDLQTGRVIVDLPEGLLDL